MKQTDIKALAKEDVFKLIDNDWMLVTAGTEDHFNTMTASWGGIGILWNRPVAFLFIRPERYTHEFLEVNERLSLSFFTEKYRKALRGRTGHREESGRSIGVVHEGSRSWRYRGAEESSGLCYGNGYNRQYQFQGGNTFKHNLSRGT